ncbi:MAG: hypothetical protein R2882_10935 [Gemmatimonadales bacterium]
MNLLRRLLWWFRRDALQAELAEEMAAHEEMKERELLARGVPAAEVAAARRRAMGNATLMREDARGVWIWPWLDRLGQDVRYALRSIRKQPTFSFGVLLLTSLGIGATTTIFSVVDGVVLRPLPYPAADRLIVFDWGAHSPPRFRDWQRTIGSVEQWAGVWTDQADLVGDGPPQRLDVARVSPDFLAIFGARTISGGPSRRPISSNPRPSSPSPRTSGVPGSGPIRRSSAGPSTSAAARSWWSAWSAAFRCRKNSSPAPRRSGRR